MTSMNPQTFKIACSNCNLRELCMPVDLSAADLDRIDALVGNRRKVARGDSLYHNGAEFNSLFAIRTGFFKTSVTLEDGREQVTGFQMAGEIMGLDGIVSDQHTCDAVALENGVMMMLGSMRAEERLAAFLLNLTTRLHARGFSRSELVLRMTREEIGSYLGLKIETVSRTFTKLVEDGVLEVKQKNLRILKPEALKELVNAPAC